MSMTREQAKRATDNARAASDEAVALNREALAAVREGAAEARGALLTRGQIVYFASCRCPRAHGGLCDQNRRIYRRVVGPDGQDHGTQLIPARRLQIGR